jgi:hypothetical protein
MYHISGILGDARAAAVRSGAQKIQQAGLRQHLGSAMFSFGIDNQNVGGEDVQ